MNTQSPQQSVDFVGESGPGAMINQYLPQPGQHVGRRILQLEDISDEWFLDSASEAGTPWSEHFGLEKLDAVWTIRNPEQLTSNWFSRYSKTTNVPKTSVRRVEASFNASARTSLAQTGSLLTWARDPIGISNKTQGLTRAISPLGLDDESEQQGLTRGLSDIDDRGNTTQSDTDLRDLDVTIEEEETAAQSFGTAVSQLEYGTLNIPSEGILGGSSDSTVDLEAPPQPALYIIQSVGISSHLGDYGAGETVKTFTLLPGETTFIHTRTWRATEETISNASSIIDSFDESSRERFEESVLSETTDKATQEKSENWYVEAEAKGSLGIASASMSGGGGGEYASGTEEFSRSLDEAVSEHTSEASSHRENTVTSSSESSVSTEEETVVERTIKNINVRRVLNFTFRALNQAYEVKTHLKNVRIAFSNGNAGSWREVPLSGLRGLIEEVIVPKHVEEVCSSILGVVAIVRDVNESPVPVLEQVMLRKCGMEFIAKEATPNDNCLYPPPSKDGNFYYRFKRGPLAQGPDEEFPVDGVVLSKRELVMATDSVVVEALLGQADALDSYSHELQTEAIREKQLANDKLAAALQIVQSGDAAMADLYQKVFGICCPDAEENSDPVEVNA
jgi:hypothetical protein